MGLMLYYHDLIEGYSTFFYNEEDKQYFDQIIANIRRPLNPHIPDELILEYLYINYTEKWEPFPFIERYLGKNINSPSPKLGV